MIILYIILRGGSRAAATSKMERFVIIVNGFQPLTIITKRSILGVAAAIDSSLILVITEKTSCIQYFNFFCLASLRLRQPWMIPNELDRYVHIYSHNMFNDEKSTQPAIACSKLTIETLEQVVKYVSS